MSATHNGYSKDDKFFSPDVKELTDENFNNNIAKTEYMLVCWYAHWCPYCNKMKPDFDRAARHYQNQGAKI